MATMRALVLREYGGRLAVEEIARPEPAAGEVLIRVEACGLGLTVAHALAGQLRAGGGDPRLPIVPGHEAVGIVDALGAGVAEPGPGQRVMTSFYLTCGRCR